MNPVTLSLAKRYANTVSGGVTNVDSYGAVGDGITDDSSSIQSAIDAAGVGGSVYFKPGTTYAIANPLIISNDRLSFVGGGTLQAVSGLSSGDAIITLDNVEIFHLPDTIFVDGNWLGGVIGVHMVGSRYCSIHLRGDRLPVGLLLDGRTSSGATGPCSLNQLWVNIDNGLVGIRGHGEAGREAANNRIWEVLWRGAQSAVSVGIDWVQYADNNTCYATYLLLQFAGSIGIVYNSGSPSSDVQVYENHVHHGIIEANTSGCVAIDGNRTWQTLGKWPSFVNLRLSGSNTPSIDISTDSDIVELWSNRNGSIENWAGITEVQILPGIMTTGFSANTGQVYDQRYLELDTGQSDQYGFTAISLPEAWRKFNIVVDWAIDDANAGDVDFTVTVNQLVEGDSPLAGTAYNTVATSAGLQQRVQTTVATDVDAISNLGSLRIKRNGAAVADTASGDMWVYMVRLVRSA